MNEHEYIDKFDNALRDYLRPLLIKLILKVDEANLQEFDLLLEYCKDNHLLYAGAPCELPKKEHAILANLSLTKDVSYKTIEMTTLNSRQSEAWGKLVVTLTHGMDIQSIMKLLVYRWFHDSKNIRLGAQILKIKPKSLEMIVSTLTVLIDDRNTSGAHYSDNSDKSKETYDEKMSRIETIFQSLRLLDEELFKSYKCFCKPKAKQILKLNRKQILTICVAFLVITFVGMSIKVFQNLNTFENDTHFIQSEKLIVEKKGNIQIYPNEIYCENNQLVIELWIGNGKSNSIESLNFSFLLQNSSGKTIVSLNNYQHTFSQKLESGDTTMLKVIFDANQVKNKQSDLSKILWWSDETEGKKQ